MASEIVSRTLIRNVSVSCHWDPICNNATVLPWDKCVHGEVARQHLELCILVNRFIELKLYCHLPNTVF